MIAALAIPGCAQDAGAPQHAGPVAHDVAGWETATGRFTGASGHVTTGTVSVIRTDAGWVVRLGSDFTFDGAPDPIVAFGHDGYDPNARLGALKSDTGAQTYAVPASLDVGDYNEVYVWCGEFTVTLGVAVLDLK